MKDLKKWLKAMYVILSIHCDLSFKQLELLVIIAGFTEDECTDSGQVYVASVKNFSRLSSKRRPMSSEFKRNLLFLAQQGYLGIKEVFYDESNYEINIKPFATVWLTVKGDNLISKLEGFV